MVIEALQVPTLELGAELLRSNGQTVRGTLFLPTVAPSHDGPPRAEEWVNDAAMFFPFRPDGADRTMLLNKAAVVVISVAAASNRPEPPDAAALPECEVVVECGEKTFRGMIGIDMPDGQERLLDFLNLRTPFVTVADGERHHLIRKQRITQVVEVAEG